MASLENNRWELFCQYHAKGEMAARAAKMAGFTERSSEATASRLLRNHKIAARMDELRAEQLSSHTEATKKIIEDVMVDKAYVMRSLKSVAERCMQTEPILDMDGGVVFVETPDGLMAPAYSFDSRGAVAALVPLGKELGMFVDRKEVLHGKLEDMSEHQLDAIINQLSTELGIARPTKH